MQDIFERVLILEQNDAGLCEVINKIVKHIAILKHENNELRAIVSDLQRSSQTNHSFNTHIYKRF